MIEKKLVKGSSSKILFSSLLVCNKNCALKWKSIVPCVMFVYFAVRAVEEDLMHVQRKLCFMYLFDIGQFVTPIIN